MQTQKDMHEHDVHMCVHASNEVMLVDYLIMEEACRCQGRRSKNRKCLCPAYIKRIKREGA
jgi:hypothetical protein